MGAYLATAIETMEPIAWYDKIISILYNQYAMGILTGLAITLLGNLIVSSWNKPRLKFPMGDLDWIIQSRISLDCKMGPGLNSERREIMVCRLKVSNQGRSAANNVRGTLVPLGKVLEGDHRIPWYEPPRNSLTLNREDHSYLDLYGIVVGLNAVCFPTEGGWQEPVNIYTIDTIGGFQLRVTASNCKSPEKISFNIGPSHDRKPIF